jgi:endonuclease/exonuclease/phosphatase family metal-dependent hydrolase
MHPSQLAPLASTRRHWLALTGAAVPLVALAALFAGCGEDPPLGSTDAGPGRDSGSSDTPVDPTKDALADAPSRPDARFDANFDGRAPGPCDGGVPSQTLRIVAANLSSGNAQSYDEGSGARILRALKPDVALMQEFNYKSGSNADMAEFVDATFGATYDFFRGDPGNQIPNGIVSRYPIRAAGNWVDPRVNNRTFVWARIDIPGDVDLFAVSVHFLTSSSNERRLEAESLISQLNAAAPAGSVFVTIGGDFNTDNRSETALTSLAARVGVVGPYPADQMGNDNTSAPRSRPYDWVTVDPMLASRQVPTVLRSVSLTNGLVFDTRVYSPLSELMPPLLGGESAATNMQHMAVVRDFAVMCP